MKKISTFLLCLIMAFTMMPGLQPVYAGNGSDIPAINVYLRPGSGSGTEVTFNSRDEGRYYGYSDNGTDAAKGQFYFDGTNIMFKAPDCPESFTGPNGMVFTGWSLDGSISPEISPGYIIIAAEGLTLTACWDLAGDASLVSLTADNGVLDPSFSPDVYEYNVTVQYNGTPAAVRVTAIPADSNATVTYTYDNKESCPVLNDGEEVPIIVKNGANEKVYRVRVSVIYSITAEVEGNGSVKIYDLFGKYETNTGNAGELRRLTATPADGWQFREWQLVSGNGTLVNTTPMAARYYIGSDNAVVKAVFEEIPQTEPPASPPDDEVVLKQPESVRVNYPEGAVFHVEVKDPDSVESYRWEYTDGYHVFGLDGTSASTDTLVLPSTMQDDPEGTVTCIITDKNGMETVTEPATITIANPDEDKTVLYVGDYAVMPGETFDIGDTQLGSGTVIFDKNGSDIILKNVTIETPNAVFDSTLSPSFGLVLSRRNSTVSEYNIHLDGDCSIRNSYYDETINASGITLAAYLYSDDEDKEPPLIRFDGSGRLILCGGTDVIYTGADMEFDTDAVITPAAEHFCDGIVCRNLYVEQGRRLDLKVNGTGIESCGQIFVRKGAVIDIDTTAPHVSIGDTNKGAMFLYGLLTMTGAKINIHCHAYPEQFIPYDAHLLAFGGIIFSEGGAIEMENSSISIDLDAAEGGKDYAFNYFGILDAGDNGSIAMDRSEIGVRLDSKNVTDSNGVYLLGNMIMQNGSRITCDMHNKGVVRGAATEGRLTIMNSDADVNVSSCSGDETYGILCGSTELNLGNTKYSIVSKAAGGMAFAANTGKQDKKAKKYDASYKMTRFTFKGNTMCAVPKKSAISLAGIPGSMAYIRVETFYDRANTKKPAQEVRIVKGSKAANPLKIKGKTATVKYSILKIKNQTLKVSSVISTTKKGKGTLTYTKASGNKNITVNKKTGKVTIKKGLKKGTYKVKVKVRAAGTKNYKPVTRTVTFTIRVK